MSSQSSDAGLTEERPPAQEQAEGRLGRSLGFGFVALVAVALIALLGYGFVDKGGSTGALALNRPAPDFTLELFDGQTFTLSEMRGRPVVLNFWASWCPSCREEAPVLEEGWRKFKDRGVVFLGVNVMDSEKDALEFMDEFDVTYANGQDPGDKIYAEYGATGVPETFFINSQGIITRKFIGPLKENQLAALTEELLP
ncbi:MAG: TlpA disulfide reductase family protein [Chloroflexota bacterium]|nr:TlpA disulfide reductase family protein [Chloroflexota bacterium]